MAYTLSHHPEESSSKTKGPAGQSLWNPHHDMINARQLSENVDEFLERVPPSSTPSSDGWIWVANPYAARRSQMPDVAGFMEVGEKLLNDAGSLKDHIATKSYPRTKKAKSECEKLQHDILQAALKHHLLTGKWMLFPRTEAVDTVWRTVVSAVINDQLGVDAKVAASSGEGKSGSERLICIYTKDFSDIADVRRVLERLLDLGLVDQDAKSRGIYYKADAYTWLGIESGNAWGLKASLYSSRNVPSVAPMTSNDDDDWNY